MFLGEVKYKYGVRVERTWSLWFGIGIMTKYEKGIVISLGWLELTIGKVYK